MYVCRYVCIYRIASSINLSSSWFQVMKHCIPPDLIFNHRCCGGAVLKITVSIHLLITINSHRAREPIESGATRPQHRTAICEQQRCSLFGFRRLVPPEHPASPSRQALSPQWHQRQPTRFLAPNIIPARPDVLAHAPLRTFDRQEKPRHGTCRSYHFSCLFLCEFEDF